MRKTTINRSFATLILIVVTVFTVNAQSCCQPCRIERYFPNDYHRLYECPTCSNFLKNNNAFDRFFFKKWDGDTIESWDGNKFEKTKEMHRQSQSTITWRDIYNCDGFEETKGKLQHLYLTKCRKCSTVLWLNDVKLADEWDFEKLGGMPSAITCLRPIGSIKFDTNDFKSWITEDGERFYTCIKVWNRLSHMLDTNLLKRWMMAHSTSRSLSISDYVYSLEQNDTKSNLKKEKYVRLHIYNAFCFRTGYMIKRGTPIFVDESEKLLFRENYQRLIELFTPNFDDILNKPSCYY
jgi:hypothetical protein